VKALSIRQPWTAMIVHGQKRIENRSRRTNHRGLVALHASGKDRWDPSGQYSDVVYEQWRHLGWSGVPNRDSERIVYGAVLGVAEIADVCDARLNPLFTDERRCDCGRWAASSQAHWHLVNVTPLPEPVPCRGALGLWTLPDEVEAAVVAQLEEQVTRSG
jgi:hypothetical protein